MTSDQEDPESVKQEFETKFKHYEEIAGEKIKDPKSDKEIPAVSPVLQAKNKLRGPKWSKVENLEWRDRKISETLIIKSLQMEHHESPITVENETRDDVTVYLYIFPQGYIENATFHIYYRKEKAEVDVDKPPYTVVTKPYRGEAVVISGIIESDVHAPGNEEEDI